MFQFSLFSNHIFICMFNRGSSTDWVEEQPSRWYRSGSVRFVYSVEGFSVRSGSVSIGSLQHRTALPWSMSVRQTRANICSSSSSIGLDRCFTLKFGGSIGHCRNRPRWHLSIGVHMCVKRIALYIIVYGILYGLQFAYTFHDKMNLIILCNIVI